MRRWVFVSFSFPSWLILRRVSQISFLGEWFRRSRSRLQELVHVSKRDIVPSSCFRFFDFGGVADISPFGVPLLLSLACSLSTPFVVAGVFAIDFFFKQLSTCSFKACRMIGRLQCGQETNSGDSSMGILPYVSRSCGSSCLATGDPMSELGGD